MTVYKKRAPYYKQAIELLKGILELKDYQNLSEFCIFSIKETCRYLGWDKSFDIFSEMDLGIETVDAPDEWELEITKKLNGDIYVNPLGGAEFFEPEKYKNAGIQLEYIHTNLKSYIQRIGHFVPGLSIIDVLMFNTVEVANKLLDDYKVEIATK